jgi:hypothetical protein
VKDEKQDLINSIVTNVELLENILYHDRHDWNVVNPKNLAKEAREYLDLRYNASELSDLIIRDGKERRTAAWDSNRNVLYKKDS